MWALTPDDAAALVSLGGTDVRTLDVASYLQARPVATPTCDIALLGSWSWRANARGLEWFTTDVVPQLPRDVRVEVAGAGADWLRDADQRLVVRGRVEDAEGFLASSRVIAVPAVAGAGVQIKTLDAIASGVPVVATEPAVRGLDQLPPSVAVAEGAEAFASHLMLLARQTDRERSREAALAWSSARGGKAGGRRGELRGRGGVSVRRLLRDGGLPLAAIVVAAAALRFATLGVQSFSDDELFTAWLVRMPFDDMLSTVPNTEATPHLFYALEWVFIRIFGSGEVGMRILPALAGTLTVPVVYVIGALAGSRRVGLAVAVFAAVNPFLIWYSQESRAYALLIFFTALALACLVAYAVDGNRRALAGWAAASVAALASHYFAIFVIAPEALWLVLDRRAETRVKAAAIAAPGLAGLALLPLALHQRNTVRDPGGLGDASLTERVVAIPKNFLVGFSIPAEAVVTGMSAGAAAIAVILVLRARGTERQLAFATAALAACGVGLPLVLAPFGLDYASSRNVVCALVPTAVFLGVGFSRGRIGVAALAVTSALAVITVVGVALSRDYQRRDWEGAAAALGPVKDERALIFSPAFSDAGPFRVYYGDSSRILVAPQGAGERDRGGGTRQRDGLRAGRIPGPAFSGAACPAGLQLGPGHHQEHLPGHPLQSAAADHHFRETARRARLPGSAVGLLAPREQALIARSADHPQRGRHRGQLRRLPLADVVAVHLDREGAAVGGHDLRRAGGAEVLDLTVPGDGARTARECAPHDRRHLEWRWPA